MLGIFKNVITKRPAQSHNVFCKCKFNMATIASWKLDSARKMLGVDFSNGKSVNYPYVWLRDNCPAEHTFHVTESMAVRYLFPDQLNTEVQPDLIEQNADGLKITWPSNKVGHYSADWLLERDLSSYKTLSKFRDWPTDRLLWHSSDEFQRNHSPFDFEEIMNDDLRLHDCMLQVAKLGLCVVENVPKKEGPVRRIVDKFGFVFQTIYPDVWDVRYKAKKTQLGDSNEALCLHTDIDYFNSPPVVEIFHGIKEAEVEGGVNQFRDGFAVAEMIRKQDAELYKFLCTQQYEYSMKADERVASHVIAKWPIISLDENSNVYRVAVQNCHRTWFFPNTRAEDIQSAYKAYQKFHEYLYEKGSVLNHKIRPGQLVFFDNHRVLHGRTAFTASVNASRHLQGAYISWDSVKSFLNLVRRRHHIEGYPPPAV